MSLARSLTRFITYVKPQVPYASQYCTTDDGVDDARKVSDAQKVPYLRHSGSQPS